MKSVMAHQFSQVPRADIPRSTFDRSSGLKTTFDADYLVPILCDEVLPGDHFKLNMTAFARLATPIKPLLDNLYMDTFFFAIPNRLIFENWHKLCGAQDDPGDSIDFTMPETTSPAGGYLENTLSDYLGLPTKIAALTHSAMWHRAYNIVYNQWFRDQNLQDSVIQNKGAGPDTTTDYTLLKRGKRHDYFTSSLPWPQKGDSISLPLGTRADIKGLGTSGSATWPLTNVTGVRLAGGTTGTFADASNSTQGAGQELYWEEDPANAGYPNIYADLSSATSATINQLRQSFQIQKLVERDARAGTRLTEVIKSHFGVTSPDARLQRAEFLGGGSSPVTFSAIAQTSSTDVTTPQGNLSAQGTVVLNNHGFSKAFTEHCIILGLVNVRADLTYQDSLERQFSRSTRYDFYWPALSHIGEQSVLNKEIFCDASANDDLVFGYQERYAEYRYKPSKITGQMRSNATTGGTLDFWHVSEDFSSLPALNSTFITTNTPIDRIVAVANEPHFLFDAYFDMKCTRPMPLYGTPGLMDHF